MKQTIEARIKELEAQANKELLIDSDVYEYNRLKSEIDNLKKLLKML